MINLPVQKLPGWVEIFQPGHSSWFKFCNIAGYPFHMADSDTKLIFLN